MSIQPAPYSIVISLLILATSIIPTSALASPLPLDQILNSSGSSISGAGDIAGASNMTAKDIINMVSNMTGNNINNTLNHNNNPLAGGSTRTNNSGINENSNKNSNSGNNNSNNNSNLNASSASSSSTGGGKASSSFITSNVVINEVELDPPENEVGRQWIELYNPAGRDATIDNFRIVASFSHTEISLPQNAVIKARGVYLVQLFNATLPHLEILTLVNGTDGRIVDKTPALLDTSADARTWQRCPDGYNEWRFVTGTPGQLNCPNATKSETAAYQAYPNSDAHCLGSAGCAQGMATRIVNADTLYVKVNNTAYKIELALTKLNAKSDQDFIQSTSFTRNLCLGSNVLVDQDDNLLTSNGGIVAVVYCSGINLNSELLNNGFAVINKDQCGISEFSNQTWAKDHGC